MSLLSIISLLALAAPPVDSIDLGTAWLVVVHVPAGAFRMGTDSVVTAGSWTNPEERPVHHVIISRDFWMGRFVVTQAQWRAVMGNNPSFFKDAGPDHPVEQVTFNDVQTFLAEVNASQHGWQVRLPTEAEWEYAARAGSTGERYGVLDDIAWYGGNASHTTHVVGEKQPNAFGLYDMLGNVWQWCEDWFEPYSKAASVDPRGALQGDRRITRGGCFYCDAIHERAARRNRDEVNHSWRSIGFRIVAIPR